jgi:hypothetical protein
MERSSHKASFGARTRACFDTLKNDTPTFRHLYLAAIGANIALLRGVTYAAPSRLRSSGCHKGDETLCLSGLWSALLWLPVLF